MTISWRPTPDDYLARATGPEILEVLTRAEQDLLMNPADYHLAARSPGARKVIEPCTQADLLRGGLYAFSLLGGHRFFVSQLIPQGFFASNPFVRPIAGQVLTESERWLLLKGLHSFVVEAMGVFGGAVYGEEVGHGST
jgi:hypothetical protein